MHDWTLLSIAIDWKTGAVALHLASSAGQTELRAEDMREIRIPRAQPWGPSVSINTVDGPNPHDEGLLRLAIEIQSGDLIEIVARSFKMPDGVRNAG
jgi:hypothetical protein